MFALKLVHRQELVEHAIVEHKRHTAVCWVILYTEETLRGVVCLHIVHALLGNELFILFTIRCESNTAMEEYLQIRPYLLQMLLTTQLHYTH